MSLYQVYSEISGTIWKVAVGAGDEVAVGDELMIIESMKMEIPVISEANGTVESVVVEQGASVTEGDALVSLAVRGAES